MSDTGRIGQFFSGASGRESAWFKPIWLVVIALVVFNTMQDRISPEVYDKLVVGGVAAMFCLAAWKRPAVAAGILLFVAMQYGSWAILAAAPVTVMLARRDSRQRSAKGRRKSSRTASEPEPPVSRSWSKRSQASS